MQLFTVGHSAHPIEKFILLLKLYDIQLLVDVRSVPASRFHPQYQKRILEKSLAAQGIQYHYLGSVLGGRPADPSCYPAGTYPRKPGSPPPRPDFRVMMDKDWFVGGMQQLLDLARQGRTAVLCSEEDPARCHRHHLIAEFLHSWQPEIAVEHIRGDGTLVNATRIRG